MMTFMDAFVAVAGRVGTPDTTDIVACMGVFAFLADRGWLD